MSKCFFLYFCNTAKTFFQSKEITLIENGTSNFCHLNKILQKEKSTESHWEIIGTLEFLFLQYEYLISNEVSTHKKECTTMNYI